MRLTNLIDQLMKQFGKKWTETPVYIRLPNGEIRVIKKLTWMANEQSILIDAGKQIGNKGGLW